MGSGLSRCCSTNGTGGDANTEFVVEQRAFAFHKWQLDVERDEQLQAHRAPPDDVYRKASRKTEPRDKKADEANQEPAMVKQAENQGQKPKKNQDKSRKQAEKKGDKPVKKEDKKGEKPVKKEDNQGENLDKKEDKRENN